MDILSAVVLAGGRGDWGPPWAGGAGPWWFLFPLLWLVLIGTVIWLLVRDRRRRTAGPTQRAIEILATRYAQGEIDSEEYRLRLGEIRDLS